MIIFLLPLSVRRSAKLAELAVGVLLLACQTPVAAGEHAALEAALSTITAGELREHAGVLADDTFEGRAAGTQGGQAAAKYLLRCLRDSGLTPGIEGRFAQPFLGNYKNLLAVIEGVDPQQQHEFVVVGAHYDHVGYGNRQNSNGPIGHIHNGADDNASGVATLLEVIDAMARTNYRPRRSILFAFWDGEEKGLLGSRYWTSNPTVPLENVRLAINIDMVGRLREGRLEVVGTRMGYGLRKHLCSSQPTGDMWIDFTWQLKDNSDHWSFLEKEIPAVCMHTGLHDDYHRPSDDIEKLNVDGMRQVGRYLLEQLCHLAEVDTLPCYRVRGCSESPATQRRTQSPLAPLPPRLGISWRFVGGAPSHLLVIQVQQNMPASDAGIQIGDKIVMVDGLPITSKSVLPAVVMQAKSEVVLGLLRSHATRAVADHAKVGAAKTVTVALQGSPIRLGLSWREDEAEPQAVYTTRVVPHSPAARAGIRLFDRIYALDGQPIAGQNDLLQRVRTTLAAGRDELLLSVETRGRLREVVVPMALPTDLPSDPSY